MDLASIVKARMAQNKASGSPADGKKYLKRSEIEAQREAAYLAEQQAADETRLAKLERKRKFEEEEEQKERDRKEKRRRLAEEARRRREEEEERAERARRKRLGLPELPSKKPSQEKEDTPLPEGEEDIPDEELAIKLRELGEPVKLFGENHVNRLRRYWLLIGKDMTPKMSNGPIPTTIPLLPEAEMKVPMAAPKDQVGRKRTFSQLASYFTMVLTEWERAMASRDSEVKESYEGKRAYKAMINAREDLKPLFRKMEKGDLDESILNSIVEIVHAAQERRYVDANDGYLRLSIGKAAWPIGVTMVGIHERSAREKLHESDKMAHIMSDETTRKYLQSIKRCLSYAQVRWPPDDQLQLMG